VVAHHRQVFGQSGKESLTVMTDVRRFSVHHFLSVLTERGLDQLENFLKIAAATQK